MVPRFAIFDCPPLSFSADSDGLGVLIISWVKVGSFAEQHIALASLPTSPNRSTRPARSVEPGKMASNANAFSSSRPSSSGFHWPRIFDGARDPRNGRRGPQANSARECYLCCSFLQAARRQVLGLDYELSWLVEAVNPRKNLICIHGGAELAMRSPISRVVSNQRFPPDCCLFAAR